MSWDEQRDDDVGVVAVDVADQELEEGEIVFLDDDSLAKQEEAKLRARCKELEEEGGRLKELYLRKLADFDNYRKRQEREMEEFKRLANAGLLRDCLPVVDNLERAVGTAVADGGGLRTGVELILKQLKDILGRHGLAEVDPMGRPFDPTLHEAIQRRETSDAPELTVLHVMQKGYLLGDRLLRPALVVVAVAPSEMPQDAPGSEAAAELPPLPDPFSEDRNG